MKYSIEARDGYLHAAVSDRDTADEMRDFLLAVHAASKQHDLPKIVMAVRRSRAVFKPEDYGLSGNMRGYVNDLVTPACQIALVADTAELHTSHEYIEMVARQQGVNVRAFPDEASAVRWMRGDGTPQRRYRFTRIVIAGAPSDAGVYALWDGEEVVYHGRADGGSATIRSRLLEHYYADKTRATHYSWELCPDPVSREAELLAEHERIFGRPPRLNAA
jgi:hypothetical protein